MGKQPVLEIEGSIDEFMQAVRAAFRQQFETDNTGYLWVRDIFEEEIIAEEESDDGVQLWRVPMTVDGEEISFEAREAWEKVKLTYTAEMISAQVVTEFKSGYPEVPARPGVDLEALTAGDESPHFLTLEVSHVGRVSRNGLLHTQDLADTIVNQINSQAAEGIMGHIKPEERSTAFPVSDIHWVGAIRSGDQAWAKGYIPKTAENVREHFRILAATGGKAATSITGPAVREFVDKTNGVWQAKGFELEQLDLAPFSRAALPPESGFVLTREMQANYQVDSTEDDAMKTREDIIRELKVADLPASLVEAVVADHQAKNQEGDRIQELEQAVQDKDTIISELRGQVQTYQKRDFEDEVDAVIAELVKLDAGDGKDKEDRQKKIDAFTRNFRRTLLAEIGDEKPEREQLQETAKGLWEDEFQWLAETLRDALMGPGATVSERVRKTRHEIEDTPEAREAASQKTGI